MSISDRENPQTSDGATKPNPGISVNNPNPRICETIPISATASITHFSFLLSIIVIAAYLLL